MANQDELRAILRDIQESRGISWQEAKDFACGLLTWSPVKMDRYLTKLPSGRVIQDNDLELLRLKWQLENNPLQESFTQGKEV